ncbi:TRAP transporter small permease subunit [Neptunomonas phycophila]|uniref:TRAP transporter small permease protein n=1 Tax=Neptunomonas phycophila TaxID=1572645 RepID=A0AAW7XMN1_9GAMM|nr:TRAP transporter small permease subunit [Neptunomonas phycophila]MDO6454549.1 TRAP transporter small permease subunit [Neptunomonas phycophila]
MNRKITARVARYFHFLSCIALYLNITVLLYGVISRYLLNGAPIWSDELARFMIIGTVMLTMSYVYIVDSHMRVTILDQYLPTKINLIIRIYRWVVVLLVSLLFFYGSYHYSISLNRFSTLGLGVSKMIPLLALPIGFGTLFLVALFRGPFYEDKTC